MYNPPQQNYQTPPPGPIPPHVIPLQQMPFHMMNPQQAPQQQGNGNNFNVPTPYATNFNGIHPPPPGMQPQPVAFYNTPPPHMFGQQAQAGHVTFITPPHPIPPTQTIHPRQMVSNQPFYHMQHHNPFTQTAIPSPMHPTQQPPPSTVQVANVRPQQLFSNGPPRQPPPLISQQHQGPPPQFPMPLQFQHTHNQQQLARSMSQQQFPVTMYDSNYQTQQQPMDARSTSSYPACGADYSTLQGSVGGTGLSESDSVPYRDHPPPPISQPMGPTNEPQMLQQQLSEDRQLSQSAQSASTALSEDHTRPTSTNDYMQNSSELPSTNEGNITQQTNVTSKTEPKEVIEAREVHQERFIKDFTAQLNLNGQPSQQAPSSENLPPSQPPAAQETSGTPPKQESVKNQPSRQQAPSLVLDQVENWRAQPSSAKALQKIHEENGQMGYDKGHHVSSRGRDNSKMCYFCKGNSEPASVYTSHSLVDMKNEIACPKLASRRNCSICEGRAHDSTAHVEITCPVFRSDQEFINFATSYGDRRGGGAHQHGNNYGRRSFEPQSRGGHSAQSGGWAKRDGHRQSNKFYAG
ncbi:nanos RNA binding domain-containing protein [Ditylenchus destructor]|uniref:Nanos RNA binding domain-containing protein n=1 Tax=Ditylenchus destructor TaxID=166010 RepID=A0AAD4NLA6_9BILA|nr:nanos RNA binding domain-containing protein [Ditylenchus destructor]